MNDQLTSSQEAAAKRAGTLLRQKFHCSEAVLLAVGEHEFGKLSDQAVMMSNAFCGGVASSHDELCGALSAGMMVIGGKYGRITADQPDKASLAAAAELRNRFIEHFGTSICDPIRSRQDNCVWVVEDTSRIIFDVLATDWDAEVAVE